MTQWRKYADGTMAAPRRGKPPVPPEGYEATSDPYICVPILVECEWRTTKSVKRACCNQMIDTMWCETLDRKITKLTCQACGGREEWIVEYLQKFG